MRKRVKVVTLLCAGAATLHAAPAAFVPILSIKSAKARVVPVPDGHTVRHVQLPGISPGTHRTAVWIMAQRTGRIRLCVLGEAGKNAPDDGRALINCSPWSDGAEQPGRFTLTYIRRYVPGIQGRRTWAHVGIWVLDYQTGKVSACLIRDLTKPVDSLRCSEFK